MKLGQSLKTTQINKICLVRFIIICDSRKVIIIRTELYKLKLTSIE